MERRASCTRRSSGAARLAFHGRNLTEEAGIRRGALYHHFASLVDLIAAVFQAEAAGAIERARARRTPIDSPIEDLLLTCLAWRGEAVARTSRQRMHGASKNRELVASQQAFPKHADIVAWSAPHCTANPGASAVACLLCQHRIVSQATHGNDATNSPRRFRRKRRAHAL
ncbi:MAG TPA: TetR/AcrR family transcriptional regulator [Myxococcales bacterium]|nr:TetR/AcrR family transcriptional regulator [Myxococcales bacterium]